MELSRDWDNGRLQDVREMVGTLISRLESFTSHSEVEVQERVCPIDPVILSIPLIILFQAANAVQLFAFIRADLASFRPDDDSTIGPPVNETGPYPAYPKSLLLINPLFSAYDLNPVNTAAQDSIPVPESLDLDAWIVPPPREYTMPDAVPDYTPEGERPSVKKKLKGKGKHKGKEKMPQATTHSSQTEPILSPGLSETEEDKVEREKAS